MKKSLVKEDQYCQCIVSILTICYTFQYEKSLYDPFYKRKIKKKLSKKFLFKKKTGYLFPQIF